MSEATRFLEQQAEEDLTSPATAKEIIPLVSLTPFITAAAQAVEHGQEYYDPRAVQLSAYDLDGVRVHLDQSGRAASKLYVHPRHDDNGRAYDTRVFLSKRPGLIQIRADLESGKSPEAGWKLSRGLTHELHEKVVRELGIERDARGDAVLNTLPDLGQGEHSLRAGSANYRLSVFPEAADSLTAVVERREADSAHRLLVGQYSHWLLLDGQGDKVPEPTQDDVMWTMLAEFSARYSGGREPIPDVFERYEADQY